MVPHQIQQFPEAEALESHDPSILVGGRDDRGELTGRDADERRRMDDWNGSGPIVS